MDLSISSQYRLITEDGEELFTHEDLINTGYIEFVRDFVPAYGRNARTGLVLGRTLISYSHKFLTQDRRCADSFAELQNEYLKNPMQFFAPSGDSARDYINDLESKICFLTAGNQCGKSATTLIKCLLALSECDKDWPIFTEHGVNWRPPSMDMYAFASYKWEHIQEVITTEMLRWVPRWEQDEFVPKWRGGTGRRRSWQDSSTMMFPFGGGVRFHAYNQDQTSYESSSFRGGWFWDEQPPEARWNGANERIRTSRTAQHNHCLTPHRLEGMEEYTGAGTFLHDLYDGRNLKGYAAHQVKRYSIHRMNPRFDTTNYKEAKEYLDGFKDGSLYIGGDVPDWIYPYQSRIEAYEQSIVEPLKTGNYISLSSGRSRTFGIFESSETMMVPEFDAKIHMIDPFDIPYANVTLYRYYDHGRVRPAAALWGMVPRPGWTTKINGVQVTFPEEPIIIFYREYYVKGLTIQPNAHAVVRDSGNLIAPTGNAIVNGRTYKRYEEKIVKEKYLVTKGDMGSLTKPVDDGSMTIQQLYKIYGLNMQLTTRKLLKNKGEGSIDIMREWFRVDRTKPHLFYPNTMGYTRVYFFSGLHNFKKEITTVRDPSMARSREQDDHLVQTCMYTLVDNPRYIEGSSRVPTPWDEDELDKSKRKSQVTRDPYTGYVC